MKNFKLQSFTLILVAFVLGFSEFIIVGILNDIATQFSVEVSTVGFLVTIFALIYAFSTPIIASFIGQRPLKKVLIFFMTIFTLGNICTAFAPTYMVLTLSRIIVALVSGSSISVAMAIGTHLAPLEKRAWLVSWLFSGFSVASVFGVPLGTWLSSIFGWTSAFYLISLIGIITLILIYLTLPGDYHQVAAKSKKLSDQLSLFSNRQIQLSSLATLFNLAGMDLRQYLGHK